MGEELMFGGCACFVIIFLPTIIMIALSFKSVDSNELGVRRHRHFGYVVADGELTKTGNHYVGLWHMFDIVKKTQRNRDYKVEAYTKNIIEITVEVSIQYQIITTYDVIYSLVYEFDQITDFQDAMVSDAIRRAVQSLESEIFYNQRGLVTDTLRSNVEIALDEVGYALNNLQLTDIEVPPEMDDAIVRLVSARQQAELATNLRDKQIAAAEVAKKESLHTATNTARANNETAAANFNAAREVIDAELYAKRADVRILSEMIDAYYVAFPTANEYQIMEMVKNDRYTSILSHLAGTGENKLFLDHKPTTIGEVSDGIQARLMVDKYYDNSTTTTTEAPPTTTVAEAAATTTEEAEPTTTSTSG